MVAGRLLFGVGAGWHDPEYQAFGYDLDHRLGRTEEGFAILRDLLEGQVHVRALQGGPIR